MKKIIILITIVLLLFPNFASGYAQSAGDDREGSKIYVEPGYINGVGSSIIIVSEIANGSEARFWEVTVIVLVNDENQPYWIQIHDNHVAQDPNYANSDILLGAGRVVGTVVFGPYAVYANPDGDYGALIWDIGVYSIDGTETYMSIIMQWGYGSGEPLRIEPGVEDEGGVNVGSGDYSFWHIIEVLIVVLGTIFYTHTHSKQQRISSTKYKVTASE